MPLSLDALNAVTTKKIRPKLVDNIFDSNPLWQRAKKKWYESTDGGVTIDCPLNYAQTSAGGWFSGADTLNNAGSEEITAASYSWKQIYKSVSITRADELKNSGEPAELKLLAQKMKIAEKSIMDDMGTGIYSNGTSDPKSIAGLRHIVATSNTVGGISQTSYSWWAAQADTSTTTLTIAAMQSRFNACTIGNDGPSVIPTTRALYNAYYALLQPQQRFQDSETAKGGFSSLQFNGVPVIVDSHCPSGYMYFLNEDYLHMFYHPEENFRFDGWQTPVNQAVKLQHIFWMGALGSSNNRMHGVMTALTA
jgi:hypothetical protein